MPEVNELSSLKEFNAEAYRLFPDIRISMEDVVAEGDKVVYRGSACGTHIGDFMGLAPTGKQVSLLWRNLTSRSAPLVRDDRVALLDLRGAKEKPLWSLDDDVKSGAEFQSL